MYLPSGLRIFLKDVTGLAYRGGKGWGGGGDKMITITNAMEPDVTTPPE